MVERMLRIKWFLGSTIERVQEQMDKFLVNLCPGNYVDLKLWKYGNIYQAVLVYVEVVPAEANHG
jgi:hypothetical protein